METTNHQLQPDVAAKYECPIVPTRIELQYCRRTIDLRTLTVAEADELVKDPRFTYLIPRRTKPRAAKRSQLK